MKQYKTPELSLISVSREDIMAASDEIVGFGFVTNFSDLEFTKDNIDF